jgi:L-malate glycosyltransferase
MKVLHLSSEKGWRGGEQQIAYLISELSKSGVTNLVMARKDSDFERYCISQAVPVFGAAFRSSVDIRTAMAIRSLCANEGVDLVHMHSAKSHSLGVLSSVLGNTVPLLLSRRVDFVPKNNWFTRWKYNHPSVKRVLCVSDKINSIMKAYLEEPGKSLTVHSGVDLSRFSARGLKNKLKEEFGIPDTTFVIGNSSALEGHKDYFTFIRTIQHLVTKNLPIHAFIMGSGTLDGKLREYVRELQLERHITFTGYRKDITEVLPCLDVFLMTSNEEGLGTSVLDAFVAKVPVVATSAGGIPEMVLHEQSGLLAPVANDSLLARNIERLMSDRALRTKIINGASDLVKIFSKENTASKTLAVYMDVLERNSANSSVNK